MPKISSVDTLSSSNNQFLLDFLIVLTNPWYRIFIECHFLSVFDAILLLDEIYLQQQVQYDGQTLTGCDCNFQMYHSILCYMVVSLTSVPFLINALPLTKISSDIVCSGIFSRIEILTQNNFYLRGITSDKHPTNVGCYGKQLTRFPSTMNSECILIVLKERNICIYYSILFIS